MADITEREATCRDCFHFDVCDYHITELTTMTVNECSHKFVNKADVVEVQHASWTWGYQMGGHYGIWCTNCCAGWMNSVSAEWIAQQHDYCPKCGAKMDGKGEGDVV